jgi:hypothetical protein
MVIQHNHVSDHSDRQIFTYMALHRINLKHILILLINYISIQETEFW